MYEGRLGATRRRSKHIRKVTHVLNEIIKNRQVFHQHCLAREQEDNKGKLLTQLVNIRREVVRKRVLLKCLDMRKEILATSSENSLMGAYGGRPLESFSRDVDQRIAWYHPKLRRHRHVDRLKQNSLDQGEILNEMEAKEKIDSFFNTIREEEERKALAKQRQKILPNKKKLRRLGGLLVGDDDDPREGDFPDPFGTVKKTYDQNPFEKLASLRPNYYKVDLLRNVVTTKEKSSLSRFDSLGQRSSVTKSPLPNIQHRRQPASYESIGKAKNRSGITSSRGIKTKERTNFSDANSDGDIESVNNENLRRSALHGNTSRPDLTRVNSLILPPIQVTKSMMKLKL